jgi:hypothetical protein
MAKAVIPMITNEGRSFFRREERGERREDAFHSLCEKMEVPPASRAAPPSSSTEQHIISMVHDLTRTQFVKVFSMKHSIFIEESLSLDADTPYGVHRFIGRQFSSFLSGTKNGWATDDHRAFTCRLSYSSLAPSESSS